MGRFESIFKNLFSDLQQEGTCIIWPKTIPLRPGSFQKMQRFYWKIRDDHSRKVPSIYYVSIFKGQRGSKTAKIVSKKCPKLPNPKKVKGMFRVSRSVQKCPEVSRSVQKFAEVSKSLQVSKVSKSLQKSPKVSKSVQSVQNCQI